MRGCRYFSWIIFFFRKCKKVLIMHSSAIAHRMRLDRHTLEKENSREMRLKNRTTPCQMAVVRGAGGGGGRKTNWLIANID